VYLFRRRENTWQEKMIQAEVTTLQVTDILKRKLETRIQGKVVP
jgi:hypothetical protein